MTPTTLFDKIWQRHGWPTASSTSISTSSTRSPRRRPSTGCGSRTARCAGPIRTLATADHNVPTDDTPVARMIRDELSRKQVEKLEANCREFGVPLYSLGSDRRGIVHVIGPELGVTQPGMTIVCGDSHTSTHGAFGALASRHRHLRGSSTSWPPRRWCRSDRRRCASTDGPVAEGVGAKDMILATIGRLGTGGMTGHVVEYAGEAVRAWRAG